MEEMRGNQQTNSLSRSFEHETNPQQRDEGLLTWILTGDYQHDSIVRAEFAYESAPDSQLCLNILGFVSNFLTTSMFLLNMCEKLLDSLSLKAVSDRSFLLQIIKSLILAAKVQISSESTRVYSAEDEVPDNVFKQLNNVIKSHDEISSRMEVVLLLEAAGCFHLINKKQPNFRQLRQKLIDEERWQLALEVSTKCGLDAATVWASWGIVCLRAGNLNGARSRLSKCLEPRRVSPILDEVVNVLEALAKTQRAFLSKRNNNLDDNNPHYLQSRLDRLNAICEGSLTHLLDLKEVKYSSRDRCLNEAEFYLKTYGSPESLLSFYVRHSMLSAGIQYAKKNKAPVEMFVNGFWIPACQVGCMEDLLKMIKQIDPLLEFWRDYICEVCKELRKKYFFHTAKRLYSWIGDWVQAGHACCTIYRMYSSDFKRMSQGKKLLQEAEVHFNQFLESKIAMGFTLIDDEVQAVEHALKVTKLQIEASDYIAECQEQLWKTLGSKSVLTYLSQEKKSSGSLSKRGSTLKLSEQNQRIPTLFDDEAGVKSVLELLIMAPTVDPSRLQLAWKISAEMEVPWKPILEKCVVTLSVNRRFSELSVFVNFIRYQQRISGDSNSKLDEALMKAVKQLNADEPAIKDSELIIGLIEALSVKVLTYLSLGWLQSAYALAVRSQSVPDVRRILEECEKRNETGIQRLCCNWLALYGNR
ncbi:zinc finger FYVE domain-containing protein 26-like [Artemia franciscana]|uniref:zinc finger FYVE domain-containing protein 26-like n=1 Tax=Artemia franciscana TaxID=6661 RepID=UPI0032DB6BCC